MSSVAALASWGGRFLDLLLPPACAGCAGPLPGVSDQRIGPPRVCPGCRSRLKAPPHPRCPRCHAPRGTGLPEDRPCNECRDWPDILVASRSAVVLEPPADRLVHALKYGGWSGLARELGARTADLVRTADLSAVGWTETGSATPEEVRIVPMPTTPGRLRARGYNQARLLAQEVAIRTGWTLVDALDRRGGGPSQVALPPEERRANVEGAFSPRAEARSHIRDKDLVLVDDVLTTGATASSAARSLGDGGARSVRLLTFARSLPGSE